MPALQTATKSFAHKAGVERNHFLFIASGWWGAMTSLGGVASYMNSLMEGLMSLGDTAKVLLVVRPDEKKCTEFLEKNRQRVIPFQMEPDDKPTNWLGRKCVSFLEILRCVSPACRRILESTLFFKASTAAIARFETILQKEKPTAILFVYFDLNLYPLALPLLQRHEPYGMIAHDSEISWLPNRKRNDLVKRRTLLKGASWIAANSCHTKSLFDMWGVPEDKVKIIYPPISNQAITESDVPAPLSEANHELALVTICRLVKGKGIDIVLRALKILATRSIPFRYAIGGEGPERQPLDALANVLGLEKKVQFKGPLEGAAKWDLLRHSSIYVMPSRFDSSTIWREGFGIAFTEAAVFGVPAVASNSGGIPDAVIDGETGILVPEESPTAVADALTFLYQNPETCKRMGRAARERARKQFSPAVIASRFREEISSAHWQRI
jgi:glycosyltransferase involved in cell wall biosynthesis